MIGRQSSGSNGTKQQKITIFTKELLQIKVIERYSPDVINFETKEDFIEYLDKHREELNQLSTCKLNKLCKIKGYHITKLNGEISLRSARKSETIESKSESERIMAEIENLKTVVRQLHINYQTLLAKLSEAGIMAIVSDEEA